MEFYPSITEDLLLKAIEHAKQHVEISEEDVEMIMHARKSLLFNKDEAWVKRDNESTFDVTMGSYDGAEVYASWSEYTSFRSYKRNTVMNRLAFTMMTD